MQHGRDCIPLGPCIPALLTTAQPLVLKASVELCSAGESGPAWRRAACPCVPRDVNPTTLAGLGRGSGCCDSSDTEPRMSRVFLCPGEDSSQTRTWSPGDSEAGHSLISILHRLVLLVFLYHHSFLISSCRGYITHKKQIKGSV